MRKCILAICLSAIASLSYANLPYFPVTFPRDEAAHYKNIPYSYTKLIEWWYFNGKITTDQGKPFSFDVAFFNPAVKRNKQVITQPMLHIQIADLQQKEAYGTSKIYGYNAGSVATDDLKIEVQNDYALTKEKRDGKEVYVLHAAGKNNKTQINFDLQLTPISEAFLFAGNGLMPMPNNTNSYYYSIPKFTVTGTMTINGVTHTIQQQPGEAWMDHQWGDFNVQANGWEWFSLRLQNGLLANIFLNINYDDNSVIVGSANIILPNGEKKFIDYKDFVVTRSDYWYDKNNNIQYPMTYNFDFPTLGLNVTTTAAFPEQEIHGYWEGYCNATAVYNKINTDGYAYMELVFDNPKHEE